MRICGVGRRVGQRGLEFLARAIQPAEITIAVREIQPCLRIARRDRQRLTELGDALRDEVRRAEAAIRDAEEHMRVVRARIDRQDGLELRMAAGTSAVPENRPCRTRASRSATDGRAGRAPLIGDVRDAGKRPAGRSRRPSATRARPTPG